MLDKNSAAPRGDGLIDLPYPIVVEGRYDKIRLASVTSAPVITTDGFGLFRNKKKLAYLRSLCDSMGGIVILTDSDGAGLQIRSYLRTALGSGRRIFNVYIPQVEGKERRKSAPSKAGYLGVEGIDSGELQRILRDFLAGMEDAPPGGASDDSADGAADGASYGEKNGLTDSADGGANGANGNAENGRFTKAELYAAGMSGCDGAAERRRRLCAYLGLPDDISAGALAEAIDLLRARDRFEEFLRLEKEADGGNG